jgi:hypothetical protein
VRYCLPSFQCARKLLTCENAVCERSQSRRRAASGEPAENNNRVSIANCSRLRGMDGEFLDDRVGEQFCGQLGHSLRWHRLGELDFESLALADGRYLAKPEAPAGADDGLTLGVVDLGLQHDVDDESRHIPNSTRALLANAGRDPSRLAVAWRQASVARFVTCVTIGTLGPAGA